MAYQGREHIDIKNVPQVSLGMIAGILVAIYIFSTLAFLYTLFTLVMLLLFYLFDAFSYGQMISGVYMMPGFIIGFLVAPMFTKYFNPKYTKPIVLGMATFGALALILKGILI